MTGDPPRDEHAAPQPLCPVCWAEFTPCGRQKYCTDGCRKTAWAREHRRLRPLTPAPPPGLRPADGTCPHCHQPVTITQILAPGRPPRR